MCARKLPHATKTASNLSSSAQPPTAPRHTDTNDDVNRFVKWSAVYSTFSSKALCFQIAVAINSVLAFAWTNLLSLPAFSRSATVLFIGALSMLTLDSRTRTQFMCVLSLGVPLGDVWDAINLTPSDLSARLKRVQAAPQVLTFMGTLAGVWIGSRLDKDISFGRKLFFILLQLGIHMCSHLTRMLRTGEEGHLLVPMLCYHFPGLVVFIVVLRQARQPRASAGSDFRDIPGYPWIPEIFWNITGFLEYLGISEHIPGYPGMYSLSKDMPGIRQLISTAAIGARICGFESGNVTISLKVD